MKFAVLMTCFNRVETTLECLRHLFATRLSDSASFDVWLNDDGSTDGTGVRVKNVFPEVKVIKGSGHDYWCGGMRRAWDSASRHFDYDGYLWLNDDTMLNTNVFEIIFDHVEETERVDWDLSAKNDCIIVGAVCGKDGKATYGGEDENGFVIPDGTWRHLRQMNGNVVWVPRSVFGILGNFPAYLTHALGDCDYSRRSVAHGIAVYLSPCFVGECEKNMRIPAWKNSKAPIVKRVKSLYSPLGGSEPLVLFRYCLRHDGLLTAMKLFVINHIRVLFPKLWQ